MKEFLKSKTLTYNLMSFTAFKMLLVFSLLVDKPYSYQEIKNIFLENELLHETISHDTLRVYLNSLKEFGCKISKVTKNRVVKYYISRHPFELRITNEQVKDLIKVFRAVSKIINIDDLIILNKFFQKISIYIENEDFKLKLAKISPLRNINQELVEILNDAVKNKATITVYYRSAKSGKKLITIKTDKIFIENNILYISGENMEHNNYFKFPVYKILTLTHVEETKPQDSKLPEFTATYNYICDEDDCFELLDNEKIIDRTKDKVTIKITSENKFDVFQRVLSLTPNCEVLTPSNFRQEIYETLKQMRNSYND